MHVTGEVTGEVGRLGAETVNLIIAMINGPIRQRGLKLEHMAGLKEESVKFCKRSLAKN